MSSEIPSRARRTLALVTFGLAGAIAGATALPASALADTAAELQSAQQAVQESNRAYEEAAARVDELQEQIDANQEHIDELEGQLPELQERANDSIRSLYKMQQGSGGLLELLLSADDFYDLLSTIQYLDIIQSRNSEAVDELVALTDELALTQASLDAQMDEAEAEQQRAEEALDEANAARDALEEEIRAQAEAEAAARQAALEAAQRAAEEAAQRAAEQQEAAGDEAEEVTPPTFTTETGSEAPVEVPEEPDADIVVPGGEKEAFISEWSARIDAYLAGSPLAGQGRTFAEAAYEYGCDPRLSPAISTVESSTGRVCFKPYNAWGWGNASWSSWEEAIWAHVAGLASGYGGQLTYAGAQKYCPPNAAHWYASVLANMEQI